MYFKNYRLKNLLRSLSKKRCFRTRFDSQHGKVFQILAKSQWECFYHVFSSLSGKLIWKKSPLVLGEIVGLFMKNWLPITNILFKIARICNFKLKCNYLKNEKLFLHFLFHFSSLHQILNILNEMIFVIANVFAKFQTVKNLIRPLSKKRRFRTHIDSQHVKASLILAKSSWECFYHFFHQSHWNLFGKCVP